MQILFDWDSALDYPSLESFESLILYAVGRASDDTYLQDDLAQDLRIKYFECLKKAKEVSMSPISFAKYFKTSMWNYISSFIEKKQKDKTFCDIELLEQSDDLSSDELLEIDVGDGWDVEIWRLYSDGTMIEWLREGWEAFGQSQSQDGKKRNWSKGKAIDILAKRLGKSKGKFLRLLKNKLKDRQNKRKESKMEKKKKMKEMDAKYRVAKAESFREYRRKYQEQNPEKVRKSRKQYAKKNHEKLLAYHRKYYTENLKAMREYQRKYYEENAQSMREYHREYYRKHNRCVYFEAYRVRYRAKIAEYCRKYYERHGERIRKARVERYRQEVTKT